MRSLLVVASLSIALLLTGCVPAKDVQLPPASSAPIATPNGDVSPAPTDGTVNNGATPDTGSILGGELSKVVSPIEGSGYDQHSITLQVLITSDQFAEFARQNPDVHIGHDTKGDFAFVERPQAIALVNPETMINIDQYLTNMGYTEVTWLVTDNY